MRILVISDNHHDDKVVDKILKMETYDKAIHLGDSEFSEFWLQKRFDYYVAGNNDNFYSNEELIVDLDGLKTLLLHGHTRGIYVFTQTKPIERILKESQFDLIIHGHTHIYRDDKIANARVLCPGSTTYPRDSRGKSYMLVDIYKNKKIKTTFKKV